MKNLQTSAQTGGNYMILAGILFVLVNTILGLLMPWDAPFTNLVSSQAFFNRLSTATLLMLVLTIGTFYLYRFLPTADRLVDKVCFGLAFGGCCALFAHEWGQTFYLHPLAIASPQGLEALDGAEGFGLYDFEAVLAAGLYSIGWLAFSILLFIRKTYGRLGPLLVVFGFLAVMGLTATLPAPWGGVIGAVPLAMGYLTLGLKLRKMNSAGVAE